MVCKLGLSLILNKISLEQAMIKFVGKENPNILVRGGRYEALKMLAKASRTLKNYNATHNDLNKMVHHLCKDILNNFSIFFEILKYNFIH